MLDREEIERITKRLGTVHGSVDAWTASRHVLRLLDAAERAAAGLNDVWTASAGDVWDQAKTVTAVADFRPTELPSGNWERGQGVAPMNPDVLADFRAGSFADPAVAVPALLDEVDRLAREVRLWRFNYDCARDAENAAREAAKASARAMSATVSRVWRLVDRKRKTVPMEALRAALEPCDA